MNDMATSGFVPHEEEVNASLAVMREVQSLETERRIRRLVTVCGGWVFGTAMTAVAVACLGVMIHRPWPQQHLGVAIVHDNGVWEPPVMQEDLPKSRSDILVKWAVQNYVSAREGYSWEGFNSRYLVASALSNSEEQKRYQTMMADRSDPQNPIRLYGTGPGSGKADVTRILVNYDRVAENAITAVFILRVTMPNKMPVDIRMRASMTWAPPSGGTWGVGEIPVEIQEKYDPAGLSFSHYVSFPEPA